MQGAGGLLMAQDGDNRYLPMYDGNGNVHGMIKAADGSIAAAYEYDAFGKVLRESGPYAASNPFQFSTKYTDIESGLVYYGLRYYSPTLGRFVNKDPIEEQGGLNLYGFCGNNGVNRWDYLGMNDAVYILRGMIKPIPSGDLTPMNYSFEYTHPKFTLGARVGKFDLSLGWEQSLSNPTEYGRVTTDAPGNLVVSYGFLYEAESKLE